MIVLGEAILAQVLVPREDGVRFERGFPCCCALTVDVIHRL
jgi:hypothetical protein